MGSKKDFKIDKEKSYKIKAISKGMIFMPNGKFYDYNEVIEGNISGLTLSLIQHRIEIEELEEIKVSKKESPKKESVEQMKKDVQEELENILGE